MTIKGNFNVCWDSNRCILNWFLQGMGEILTMIKESVLEPSSCHSARRTSLPGVAESIIGSAIDSGSSFHYAKNDNQILRFRFTSRRIYNWLSNRFCDSALLRAEWRGEQWELMEKSGFFGKLINLIKLSVLKFIVSHPSCHSARRTSLSGVAESIIGSSIDSAIPFRFTQYDN